jgi:hypothetical protein
LDWRGATQSADNESGVHARDEMPNGDPDQPAEGSEYRRDVLECLAAFGIRPQPSTPVPLVREFLNDLYRWELRRLRDRLLAGVFPKRELAARVVALRRRYALLSLPVHAWTRSGARDRETGDGP